MHRLTQSTFVRGIILLPFLISNVIAALLWFWLLDYQIGIVNEFIAFIGLDRIAFFGDADWAIPTIAFVNVWRHMGYTALLVFAGLQTIPTYVYEAAAIDGSTEWRSFWRITLPLLRPILALVLVITVTGSFQVFDTVAVTTRGGPVNATRVIQYYIYQKGFTQGEFGYASALSVILFIILAVGRLDTAEAAERRRIRPGLRGDTMANHHRPVPQPPSRATPATPAGRFNVGPDPRLGGDDHPDPDHDLPVLLDAAHRVLHLEVAVQRPRLAAAGGLHLGAFERVLGLATPEEAKAEGGSGAAVNFWLYLRNSSIFATVATVGQVFFSALAAYAFARLRWPGRDKVFFAVPDRADGAADLHHAAELHPDQEPRPAEHLPGLVAPYFFMTPFAIFFLRQFFLGINREIEEAAKLDGAGHWRIFFRIILPMSSAPIVTLVILTFINMLERLLLAACWSATDEQTRVLTVALGVFRSQTPAGSPDWAGLMAAVLVAALPHPDPVLVFAKKVVNSIGFSGIK